MNFVNTWQFNLVGYYIFVVIFYQFYKLAVRNAKRDGAATVLLQIVAGAIILLLMPFFPMAFPESSTVYVFLVVACVFYALADRINTTARKHLEVSTFAIIGQISTVFLILIGLFFFKEPFLVSRLIGSAFILGGNALLFYKKGQFHPSKYNWLAVSSAAMFAAAISIDIGISKQFNLPFYIMFTLVVPAVMIALTERISARDIAIEFNGKDKKYYILTSIAWGLAIFFSLRSFQFGKVTTIVPLQAGQVLLNVAVAYFFLKEKKDEAKKIVAAILVIAGVYLTVV